MPYHLGEYRSDAGNGQSWNWTCDGCNELWTRDGEDPELERGRETFCDECAETIANSCPKCGGDCFGDCDTCTPSMLLK